MASDGGVFVGRREVLEVVREELALATHGPRLVWIEGEPGIGKTSVVRAALSEVEDRQVVAAAAAEEERELSFSVLDQLNRGLAGSAAQSWPALGSARAGAAPLAV